MPVYYVIYMAVPHLSSWYLGQIVKVIETTIDAVQAGKHNHELEPFYGLGQSPLIMLFVREPDNPFREAKSTYVQTG